MKTFSSTKWVLFSTFFQLGFLIYPNVTSANPLKEAEEASLEYIHSLPSANSLNFKRTYETASGSGRFYRYRVPGNGNCFWHSVSAHHPEITPNAFAQKAIRIMQGPSSPQKDVLMGQLQTSITNDYNNCSALLPVTAACTALRTYLHFSKTKIKSKYGNEFEVEQVDGVDPSQAVQYLEDFFLNNRDLSETSKFVDNYLAEAVAELFGVNIKIFEANQNGKLRQVDNLGVNENGSIPLFISEKHYDILLPFGDSGTNLKKRKAALEKELRLGMVEINQELRVFAEEGVQPKGVQVSAIEVSDIPLEFSPMDSLLNKQAQLRVALDKVARVSHQAASGKLAAQAKQVYKLKQFSKKWKDRADLRLAKKKATKDKEDQIQRDFLIAMELQRKDDEEQAALKFHNEEQDRRFALKLQEEEDHKLALRLQNEEWNMDAATAAQLQEQEDHQFALKLAQEESQKANRSQARAEKDAVRSIMHFNNSRSGPNSRVRRSDRQRLVFNSYRTRERRYLVSDPRYFEAAPFSASGSGF